MEAPVLEIQNLTKSYGKITAVSDLSLHVFSGEIWGILGPNGSGKTTTLGILLDIIKPDSGRFFWFGGQPSTWQRQRVGALLESPIFYPHLSAVNNLKLIADIKRASYHKIDELLDLVGLSARKHSKFATYSLGMKQRLAIAATLVGDPEVLILDEPTNGLDPTGIAEIRKLIRDIAKKGITIILASHLLDEVQKVCSHVVVLGMGKMLGSGKVSEVLNELPTYEMASADMISLKVALEESGLFDELKIEGEHIIGRSAANIDAGELNRLLASKNIYLTHLAQRKQSLEKYFLDLIYGSHD